MTRFVNSVPQFFDANGVPLAGGKMYIYLTTTTTLKTIYSELEEMNPIANPVILDGAGRLSDDVFWTDAANVVLKDANDVQVWASDPVGVDSLTGALVILHAGSAIDPSIHIVDENSGIFKSPGVDGISIACKTVEGFTCRAALKDGITQVQQWGSPENFGTQVPDFKVDHTFSRGGMTLLRSLWITEAGDAADLALRLANGTPSAMTTMNADQFLGNVYWLAYDGTAFLPGEIYSSVFGEEVFAGDGNQATVRTLTDGSTSAWWEDADYAIYTDSVDDYTLGTLNVLGTDYTHTGGTRTFQFIAGHVPAGGARIQVFRREDLALNAPFYGRTGNITAMLTETPTQDARGGALLFSTVKHGEVATRVRCWLSNPGWFVAAGRGVYEDDSTAFYPDSNLGAPFLGAQGAHDPTNTDGWGNFSAIASDKADAAAIAVRKYNSTTTVGLDHSIEHSTDLYHFERITVGGKVSIGTVDLEGAQAGDWRFGQNGGEPSLWIRSTDTTTNYLTIQGGATGNPVVIAGEGEAVNIKFVPKGVGVMQFGTHTGTGDVVSNGHITIVDEGGTARKLMTTA